MCTWNHVCGHTCACCSAMFVLLMFGCVPAGLTRCPLPSRILLLCVPGIERVWRASKTYCRMTCKYNIAGLMQNVPDSYGPAVVSLDNHRNISRHVRDWVRAYTATAGEQAAVPDHSLAKKRVDAFRKKRCGFLETPFVCVHAHARTRAPPSPFHAARFVSSAAGTPPTAITRTSTAASKRSSPGAEKSRRWPRQCPSYTPYRRARASP